MSERKVLTKYYPPDFDPSQLRRQKKADPGAIRVQTVRLMAPFSMKCLSCGEYIYKGRKFNSRKEVPPNEKYLNIQIFFFHIRCTRCSAAITFRTDPKNNDYAMVSGAMRNNEPWYNAKAAAETDAERLDRLEAEGEEDDQAPEDPMQSLEAKTRDAQDEMAVADALDQIRIRSAARDRAMAQDPDGLLQPLPPSAEDEQDRLDAEAARLAFEKRRNAQDIETIVEEEEDSVTPEEAVPAAPVRRVVKKKKKDYAAALGIKGKKA
ncbi:CWC16 protein [Stachybotrys elegans]|uniref:Splicing factor YJU2 n=1 Tax=Stachybotrys elegans TaxID=80388 RepID=A0A8K0T606_9HYPO|nr:CWC16 protein [Stachybotrys elegans]